MKKIITLDTHYFMSYGPAKFSKIRENSNVTCCAINGDNLSPKITRQLAIICGATMYGVLKDFGI